MKKAKREKTFDLESVKFNVKKYNPFDLNRIKEVQDKAIEIAKEEPNLTPEFYFVRACMDYIQKHNETYMDIFKRRYCTKEIDKRDFNYRKFVGKFGEEMFSANPWLQIEVFEYEDKEESEVPSFDPFDISKDKDFVYYISSAMNVYKNVPFYLYFYDACFDYIEDKCGIDNEEDFDPVKFNNFYRNMLKSNPWMDGLFYWHKLMCMETLIKR